MRTCKTCDNEKGEHLFHGRHLECKACQNKKRRKPKAAAPKMPPRVSHMTYADVDAWENYAKHVSADAAERLSFQFAVLRDCVSQAEHENAQGKATPGPVLSAVTATQRLIQDVLERYGSKSVDFLDQLRSSVAEMAAGYVAAEEAALKKG